MKLCSCPNMTDNKEYEEIAERSSLRIESNQNILEKIIGGWQKLRKLASGKMNVAVYFSNKITDVATCQKLIYLFNHLFNKY